MCEALGNDIGSPHDKRVGIEMAALKQLLARGGDSLKWVDTAVMLADPLTKTEAQELEVLEKAMRDNEFCIKASGAQEREKTRKAESRRALKASKKGMQ